MSDKIVSNLGCMDRSNPKFNWPWDEERRLRDVFLDHDAMSLMDKFKPMTKEELRQHAAYLDLRYAEMRMFRVRQREAAR